MTAQKVDYKALCTLFNHLDNLPNSGYSWGCILDDYFAL